MQSSFIMPRELPEMEFRTTIVAGDYDSFRAALTRSIVGVTFKKFKKLGLRFYSKKAQNMAIVDIICRTFYEKLQAELPDVPLQHLRIATVMKIKWDREGQIRDLSDVRISVYEPVGELLIRSANIMKSSERIQVDLFYSSVDFASKTVRRDLDLIEQELGPGCLERHEYDYLDSAGRRIADKKNVKLVPAVVINDEEPLENPSRMVLEGKIHEKLAPYVDPIDVKFNLEVTLGPIHKKLATLIRQ